MSEMPSVANLSPEALSTLVEASAAINSAQGLDETLQKIADSAAAVMRAESASVIMLDKARNKQVFRAAVGKGAGRLIGVEYDAGEGLSGQVLEARRPEIFNDVPSEKAHYKKIDAMLASQTRSLIVAPLIHKKDALGVVEVLNPLASERFSEADRELAQIFANLAAIAVANARSFDHLAKENRGLKETLLGDTRMLGDAPAMRQAKDLISRVARSNATVLLLGESGVGKELAALTIHENSPRKEAAFIPVNCAALPETLLESELFGHEAGSFTGATGRRLGRFELADGGTIFLDEIGEIAPAIQVKLLRVLQEKEIFRVGGSETIGCDVRIIAASNRDLESEKNAARFRQDLYYRLNVFPITIPPLRDRRDDLPALVEHFLTRLSAEMKIPPPTITDAALNALTRYDFPGNIRELQNVLERGCLLAEQGCIDVGQLPREISGPGEDAPSLAGNTLAEVERALIVKALREHEYNQTRAAKALGVSRDNLRYRVKKYRIDIPK
jgi:Nif-specific regulatory protein